MMSRPDSDRLYFKSNHTYEFGNKVAHLIRLSFLQGVSLGVPLSYGLLYAIQNGPVTIDNISLDVLMYLYNLDNHTAFMQAMNYISDDALEYLDDMPVGGYKQEGITVDDRLYWLKRYLFSQLYGHDFEALQGFLAPDGDSPDLMKLSVKVAALGELAELLGHPVTKDNMIELVQRANYERDSEMPLLLKYISESESESDQNKRLLIFVTGSSDPNVDLTVTGNGGVDRIPVAHTCSNTLELSKYSSYPAFKRLMDMALEDFRSFTEA